MGILSHSPDPIEDSQLEEDYLALVNLPSEPSFPPIFSAKKFHKLQAALEETLNQISHGEILLSDIYDRHCLPRYAVTDSHSADNEQGETKVHSGRLSFHACVDIHALLGYQARLQRRARKQSRALLRLKSRLSLRNQQDICIPSFGQLKSLSRSLSKDSSSGASSLSLPALLPVYGITFGAEGHSGAQSNSAALQSALAVTESETYTQEATVQEAVTQDRLLKTPTTTQTPSNLPKYDHPELIDSQPPVELATLHHQPQHPLAFTTKESWKAIFQPTKISRTGSKGERLPPTPPNPFSRRSPSIALTIPVGTSTNTTSPATISPTGKILTGPASNAPIIMRTAALGNDSPQITAQSSSATTPVQETSSQYQNTYLSPPSSSLPSFYHCAASATSDDGEGETAHQNWQTPEILTATPEFPQSKAQRSQAFSIRQERPLSHQAAGLSMGQGNPQPPLNPSSKVGAPSAFARVPWNMEAGASSMKNNVDPKTQQQLYQEPKTHSLAPDQAEGFHNSPRIRLRPSNLLLFRHPSPTRCLPKGDRCRAKTPHDQHPFISEPSSPLPPPPPPPASNAPSEKPKINTESERSKFQRRCRSSIPGTKHDSDGRAVHWSSVPQNAPVTKETYTRKQTGHPKLKAQREELNMHVISAWPPDAEHRVSDILVTGATPLETYARIPCTRHNLAIETARSVYPTPLPAPVSLRKPLLCMQLKPTARRPLTRDSTPQQQSITLDKSSRQVYPHSISKSSSVAETEEEFSVPDPAPLQTQPHSITQPLLQLVVSIKAVYQALAAILQLLLELLFVIVRCFAPHAKTARNPSYDGRGANHSD
ncbi:hypothetical protein AOQ84DRAFT_358016 [Glonium stellatum]|uniref:Uncharacterized protein n=1 Tax=Glonium stellatum TaxID=574774 RepID=A0A8E2FE32_9PEZI|nr:hypothetical protein AOQ84DRAFT_358016 [Glonium stellatum]